MDFATIGKVGSYIRQKNLSFAANYKIRTGQRVTDSSGNLSFSQSTMFEQINKTTKKTADEIKTARLATLKSKLMAGRKLSNEEMAYLRENDEDLYKKAKHADDAREELKAELKGAKSKQEARQILTRAMVKASAEASAELAACKAGIATGGGAVGETSIATGNVSTAIENISIGGELSTSIENNLNVNETSTPTENVSSVNENSTSTENISSADKNSNSRENNFGVNENSNDGENPAQGILEKFIMTIRALEDEWAKYTNSDEYKNLPEDFLDDEKVYKVAEVPNRKFLNAIYTYRQSTIEKRISWSGKNDEEIL